MTVYIWRVLYVNLISLEARGGFIDDFLYVQVYRLEVEVSHSNCIGQEKNFDVSVLKGSFVRNQLIWPFLLENWHLHECD